MPDPFCPGVTGFDTGSEAFGCDNRRTLDGFVSFGVDRFGGRFIVLTFTGWTGCVPPGGFALMFTPGGPTEGKRNFQK